MAIDDYDVCSEGEARRDCKILMDCVNSLHDRLHTFDELTQVEIQHAKSETNKLYHD